MTFNITKVNGQVKVTDAATGAPLDWVHTVDFVTSPDGTPILYLGTFDFSATITAGASAPPNPSPPAHAGAAG